MKIFSGIRPTGEFHIGNYLGAMKQWAKVQDEGHDGIYCIVDYHAITTPYATKDMPKMIIDGAKDVLAMGIEPQKSTLFLQSDIKEHTELAWILNTITSMGELSRMTQYKEKAELADDILEEGLRKNPGDPTLKAALASYLASGR